MVATTNEEASLTAAKAEEFLGPAASADVAAIAPRRTRVKLLMGSSLLCRGG
jgi:hypothetical protein